MAAIGWVYVSSSAIWIVCDCDRRRDARGWARPARSGQLTSSKCGSDTWCFSNQRPRCQDCHRLLVRKSKLCDAAETLIECGGSLVAAMRLLGLPELPRGR